MPEVHSEATVKDAAPQEHGGHGAEATTRGSPSPTPAHTKETSPAVVPSPNAKDSAPREHGGHGTGATTRSFPSPTPARAQETSPIVVPSPTHRHNTAPIPTTKAEPIRQPHHDPIRSPSGPQTTKEHNGSHTFAHDTPPHVSPVLPTAKPSSVNSQTLESPPAASPAPQTTFPSEHSRSPHGQTTITLSTTKSRFITSRTTSTPSTETQSTTATGPDASTVTKGHKGDHQTSTPSEGGNFLGLDPCSLTNNPDLHFRKHLPFCSQKMMSTTGGASASAPSVTVTADHETTQPNPMSASSPTQTAGQPTTTSKAPTHTKLGPPNNDPCPFPFVNRRCPHQATTQTTETKTATAGTQPDSGSTSTPSTTDHTTTSTDKTSKPTRTPEDQTLTTTKGTAEPLKAASTTSTTHPNIRTGHPTNKAEQPAATAQATTKTASTSTVKSQKPSKTPNRSHSNLSTIQPTAATHRTALDGEIASTQQATGHTSQHGTTVAITATNSVITAPPVLIFESTISNAAATIATTCSESGSLQRVANPTGNRVLNGGTHLGVPPSGESGVSSDNPNQPTTSINQEGAATALTGSSSQNGRKTWPHQSMETGSHPGQTGHAHLGGAALSTPDIIAISISAAVVCLGAMAALLAFLLCRRRRRRMSKTFDSGHGASPSLGSIAYLPVYSAVPVPDYQNSTHALPVLAKTEATPRHDPRTLSMYAYTAQIEKAPADAMTSYNAVYNTSNDQSSVMTNSKSVSTTRTLYETVPVLPVQGHAQGDHLRAPQDPKRVTSLTGSIASSNINYGVAM